MNENQTATILAPNGEPATLRAVQMDAEAARIMREYKKKVLLKYGLREALYCNSCFEQNRSDGCEAHVADSGIMIRCRCSVRNFMGPTY